MINRVVLVGRLTRDPELRRTGTGRAVTSFSIALDRGYQSQDGQTADFIPVVVWNNAAESVAQYTHKGSLVGVEGALRSRNYTNNQGQRVYVVEVQADRVQFLESRNSYQQNTNNNYQANQQNQYNQRQPNNQQPQQNDNFYDMKTVDLDKDFDDSVNTYDIMEDDLQF